MRITRLIAGTGCGVEDATRAVDTLLDAITEIVIVAVGVVQTGEPLGTGANLLYTLYVDVRRAHLVGTLRLSLRVHLPIELLSSLTERTTRIVVGHRSGAETIGITDEGAGAETILRLAIGVALTDRERDVRRFVSLLRRRWR